MTSMTTRTYNAIYMDGEEVMYVQFQNCEEYDAWHQCIDALKVEASRIIAAYPDPDEILVAGAAAIRNLILHVDAMVEARMPVIPSVLRARNNFADLIRE
eukprot:scaffold140367_cov54-Attheya_sp.AAC.4